MYQLGQRRGIVVPTPPYTAHVVPRVPVLVELRQIPVIHVLQSLRGRVSRPLQEKVVLMYRNEYYKLPPMVVFSIVLGSDIEIEQLL